MRSAGPCRDPALRETADHSSSRIDKDRILATVRTMSKVTSKLQLTLPKRLAEQYGIAPGDDVEFQAAGDCIRIVLQGRRIGQPRLSVEERLRLYDEDTVRQREREKHMQLPATAPAERDWTREELYTRGKPD
jgi:bifunctional DNA-binding transcriptional regulator/antitoxin component of YhaV-PrlF toxin-antitoxin module